MFVQSLFMSWNRRSSLRLLKNGVIDKLMYYYPSILYKLGGGGCTCLGAH